MSIIKKATNALQSIRNEFTDLSDISRIGYICAQHGTGKQAIAAGYQEVEDKRQALIKTGLDAKYAKNIAICTISEEYGYTPTT